MRSIRSHRQFGHPLTVLFLLLTAFSLACSLPGIFSKTPTPTALGVLPVPTITSTPAIQPPLMVESDPQAGAQLSLTNPITIYFNQPMNRLSVEGAVQMSAGSGRFDWQSDEVMTFIPDTPMLPESEVTFSISVTAQSEQGMPLKEPVELRYTTAGYLQLTQPLPGDGEVDLNPTTAVVAAFNQPVVPLGADPVGLPPAFSLEPAASGRGEWINTSTYIFYPEPQFAGGVTYTARMNSDLTSTQGAPLQEAGEWSFSFAAPGVKRVEPQKTVQLPLDAPLTVYFNQPMDAASTAEGFQLQAEGQPPVSGVFTWDDTFTTLTFTPSELLQRDQAYELALDPAAVRSAAGTPLEAPFSTTFFTVAGMFQVDSTPDLNGMMQEWEGLLIQFSSLLPKTGFEKFFRIEPEVSNLNASLDMDDTAVHFFGDFLPNRSYTVFVDPALQDRWGGALQNAYNVTFRTAPLTPRLEAPGSQSVMFLTPEDTGMAVQLTNLSSLPLSLGSIPLADFFSLSGSGGYDLRQAYQPADSQYWTADFTIPADRVTPVQLPLNAQGTGLAPGIYLLRAEVNREYTYANDFVLLVSHIHLTYKISDSDVLVWVVDTRNNQPLENAPVVIYDETGQVLASGFTSTGGVFQSDLAVAPTPYTATAAVMGQPGEEYFAAALSNWSAGIDSYNFNITPDTRDDGPFVYLYTDRPIYRPGQTVYYRGVARMQINGHYALPDGLSTLPVVIYDFEGTELAQYDLTLSAFGTLHGEFKLIEDALPGYYRLQIMDESITFQVAEYRKPEINLQVQFSQAQAQAGMSSAPASTPATFSMPRRAMWL
jgi:alpha-2-macroglobulin